ncbi:hypothetical protein AAC387_Pa07g2216 [Persea americana]
MKHVTWDQCLDAKACRLGWKALDLDLDSEKLSANSANATGLGGGSKNATVSKNATSVRSMLDRKSRCRQPRCRGTTVNFSTIVVTMDSSGSDTRLKFCNTVTLQFFLECSWWSVWAAWSEVIKTMEVAVEVVVRTEIKNRGAVH